MFSGLGEVFRTLIGRSSAGWRHYATGYPKFEDAEEFSWPSDPKDRRTHIPPLGLKEYWYPALPARDVKSKKPVGLKLLGSELIFFRDPDGEVVALEDRCPHRNVRLSLGDCFWRGYVTCSYHGATFDRDGELVEMITEGPDSKFVGKAKARSYPTVTKKGVVFVWMGDAEPVDPEKDIPPEFFEDETTPVLHSVGYWKCNWVFPLENSVDAHNRFFVHRNALFYLRTRSGGRMRTPVGRKTEIVDGKTAYPLSDDSEYYYLNKYGVGPKNLYQLYHPRVDGHWPLHRWRTKWVWLFELYERLYLWNRIRRKPRSQWVKKGFEMPREWTGVRLPGMVRPFFASGGMMNTRWGVPVEGNLTRIWYFSAVRNQGRLGRFFNVVLFRTYRRLLYDMDYSGQDYEAARSVRYKYPERLSATDSQVIQIRKLITEYGRGLDNEHVRRRVTQESMADESTGNEVVRSGASSNQVPDDEHL